MRSATLSRYNDTSLALPGWVLLFVVFGYVIMTRSFAHLGVSPLYIGEATLGLLIFFWPGMILGTWVRAELRTDPYTKLATMSAVFVVYGLLECLRGLIQSGNFSGTLQNFAFNYYVAFLFAGIWLGERHANLLPRVIWYLSWANGIYGVAWLLFFGQMVEERTADIIPVFGWPAGSAIAILGLFAYERNSRRAIVPLMLNAFVLVGRQVRAEWLAIAVAITLLSILSGRRLQLFFATVVIGALILIGAIIDVRVPSPTSRSGVISSRDLVGRAIAAVDEDAAAQLTEHVDDYVGTVSWRTEWWANLLEVTHRRALTTLFGLGYGYPIWEHNYFTDRANPTPHNIFIYVLTYTGWVGVLIFYSLQFCLAWMLWQGYRSTGQPFGICLWVLLFVWAHFDNRLETPYGAVPFWVLMGIALTSAHATAKATSNGFASPKRLRHAK